MILTVFVSTGLIYLFWPGNKVEAAWADDDWGYRHRVTFTHNADISSDRAVTFTLDTAELITAGLMQSDCDDTRFTDANGKLLLFDLTGTCNNASTTYEVIFPRIVNGSNLFYVYYGNPSARNVEIDSTSYTALTPSGGDPSLTNPTTSGDQEKAPSPFAYWKFDDAQGTTAQDTTSNNLDGTINGGATWQTEEMCIASKCLKFDGTNDDVSMSESSFDFERTDPFTIESWVRVQSSGSEVKIFSKMDNAGVNRGYELWVDTSNKLSFYLISTWSSNAILVSSQTSLNDNRWHHVAVTYTGNSNASGVTLYIDGKPETLTTTVNSLSATILNDITPRIGSRNNAGYFFNGFMDIVKIYKYTRSAAQIKADFIARSNNEGAGARFGSDPNQNLSNGLVGYWKIDESSWTSDCSTQSVLDSSGNGSTGASCPNGSGQTTPVAGKFGNAVNFDGTDDRFSVADSTNLRLTTVTVAAWVNADDFGAYNTVVSKGSSSVRNYDLDTEQTTGKPRFTFTQGSGTYRTVTANTGLTAGTWYHVVGTYDGATSKIYINGVLDNSASFSGNPDTSSDALGIGNQGSSVSDLFDGKVDDVRVYNRAMSGNEVAQLYNFAPGPILYYDMEEGSGTTLIDKSTNAISSSSFNGNTSYDNGRFGKALVFDGADDNVRRTENSTIDLGALNTSYTVEAWFKMRSNTGNTWDFIVSKFDGVDVSYPYNLFVDSSNRVCFELGDTSLNAPSVCAGSVNDSRWHHAAGVRNADTDTIDVYVDGVKIAVTVTDSTTATAANNSDLAIGNGSTSYTGGDFDGLIDDVKIYNYARTSSQVIEDMNGSHPAPGSPVGSAIAYWTFDEGYGTTVNDSASQNGSENLVMSASTNWTNAGKIGKAYNGDDNKRAEMGADDNDMDFALSTSSAIENFSFAFWFKSDSATNPTTNQYLVQKGASVGTTAAGYAIYTASSGGTICFGIDDDATTAFPEDETCSSSDIYDTTWHHIVAKKTGNTRLELYVDGKTNGTADTSISATGTIANSSVFRIGDANGTDGTDEFLGDIDELKFFRSALTDSQVKAEFNRSSSQALGAFSTSTSGREVSGANAIYCIPGDATSCAGPTVDWDLEEKTGQTVTDKSTNGRDGTLGASGSVAADDPTWTNGKIGGALSFDGTDDYVDTSIAASSFITASAGTIEVWARFRGSAPSVATSFTGDGIVGDNNGYLGLYRANKSTTCAGGESGDRIYAFNWDGNEDCFGVTYNTNEWIHLTWIHSGGTVYLYKNGVLAGSVASGDTQQVSNFMRFGRAFSSGTHEGDIDAVRTYNYARSAAQVAWDYNQGKPIAYWAMDECQGATINDSSGNSNTGTWSGTGGGSQTSAGTCTTSSTAWGNGVTGKRNYSLNFDGTDDVVRATETSSTDLGTTSDSYTVSAWFKTSATYSTNGYIIAKDDGSGAYPYRLYIDSSQHGCFQISDGTNSPSICGSIALNDGSWHRITGIRDVPNDQLRLYVDGNSSATAVTDSTTATAVNNDDSSDWENWAA